MSLRTLRVAQVICTEAFAGAERYVATMTRELAAFGAELTVIGGDRQRMSTALAGLAVRWLPGASVPAASRSLLRTRGIDLVHVHMTAAELAAVLTRPVLRVPIVATRHFAHPRGASRPGKLASTLIRPNLAAQMAISQFVADRVGEPCVVVPPATADVPGPVPTHDQRDNVVLVAQRLEPEKDTDVALQIWRRCGLAEHGWRLEIAGDGAERGRLEALAADLVVADSVRFLGVSNQMGEHYRRASVLLAPCRREGLGLSVLEAMAAGLPVVAARGGGHDETVGTVADACLFSGEDVEGAACMLADLAHNGKRRDRYAAEQRAVQQRDFSLRRQAEQTLAVYRSVARPS